ncbi:MAG: mechanosensitive ion channel family protein, partial [Aeromonas sp.]
MKEAFFHWLSGFGIEMTNLMELMVILGLILVASLLLHMMLRRVLLVWLVGLLGKTKQIWVPQPLQQRLFHRLAWVLEGIVLQVQAQIWLPYNSDSLTYINMVAQLWILLFLLLAFFTLLDCVLSVINRTHMGRNFPLRGIFQGIKLLASVLGGVLIIALLLGQSPLYLFSGLGAMTAVLMLIFKDPLLGLVAGIQLSANRMLNVGDWLEMDKCGANGEVIDIGLTTVKVSNWDNTITTIPTYTLISDSFINWQGMAES